VVKATPIKEGKVGLQKTPGFHMDSSTAEDKGKGEVGRRGRGEGGTK